MRTLVALLAASLVLPAASLAADRFTDPRGDAGEGPDITAVTLSHTDTELAIAVEFASVPPLAWDQAERYTDMLLIGIHTDDDLTRRDVEFFTGVHAVDMSRAPVVRGGAPAEGAGSTQVGTAEVAVDGATVTLRIERRLLGDPESVAIDVAAGREGAEEGAAGGGADSAPAAGPHRYALEGGGTAWFVPLLVASVLAAVAIGVVAVLTLRRSAPRPPAVQSGP